MAINYLNSIDLNRNELQDAQLIRSQVENQPNDAAVGGTPVEGQLYFNTSDDVLKVYANGAWVEVGGGVETLTTTDGTYIDLTPNSATAGAVTVTADLSAIDGTSGASERYLTKTNKWAEISTIPGTYTWSIQGDTGGPTAVASGDVIDFAGGTNINTALASDTLTINLNDSITLTGQLTVLGNGQNSFTGQVTIPILPVAQTDAASKDYVDNAVVGGLIYQGSYDAATNTPDLTTSPNSILKGWTYTVTVEGTFFGEQLRVGDVLIAEENDPSALTDWTTVQNNIDLASLTQVGIGNVNAGTGIDVAYASGTATVSLTAVSARSGSIAVATSTTYTYPNSITAGATNNVLIQLVDGGTGETVYADVTRLTTTTFSVDYGVTTPTGVIALIQLIG